MKKSMQFRFAVMFSLFVTSIFMTNEVVAQKQAPSTFAEKAVAKIQLGFSFNIATAPCFAGGTSFRVEITKPEKYAYLWDIDGRHGGHQMYIGCVCGDYAKVRVMRLSDGFQVTRTIKLGSCGGSSFYTSGL